MGVLPVSTRKAFFFDTGVLCKDLKRVLSFALRNPTVGLDLGFLSALILRTNIPAPLGQGVGSHLHLVT